MNSNYNLADSLEKKARYHLKRITTVLPEFDIHDEKHSEKIIFNIEKLLGDSIIREMSCYELFLIQLAAFFHDCAMAPSDWELKALKMTEGSIEYYSNIKSIKNDLKAPYKLSNAINLVKERKGELYGEFKGDVKDWMFSPDTEQQLIQYLGELLIDYQNHRNGFADQLKKIKTLEQFKELNEFIRIDFIRATHHSRIEIYIKNLEKYFANAFEQPAWGKKLAHDLSLICRSHGEDISYINAFNKNAQYYGSQSANLQFIAIMLRLGDIIHFSFDRAPIDLRSSRIFKSEYSFQQWAIKNSGANYTIENGLISFRAYCEEPDTYFKLHQYLDYIEIEIQNYFKYQRQWDKDYIPKLQDKIERTNINNDAESFLPKRGLSFTLNQNKIIELLMGVGLYKNKLACLRELYQNSLDACKCMLSHTTESGVAFKGEICFGLIREEEKVFLYCFDNGIGMTKDVIENYLLKIGNSYYKSSDFFKQQANWGGRFTPTSQFGIGILSCFMIGERVEVTTKPINGDFISCTIDGPHENFYYKKTASIDKERFANSGTLVKIQLNTDFIDTLTNTPLDKLGLLLFGIQEHLPEKYKHYLTLRNSFENHLYNKINAFIEIVPDDILVSVQLDDNSKQSILSKPLLLDPLNNILNISDADFELIDYQNSWYQNYPTQQKFSQTSEFLDNYRIEIKSNGVEYACILILPKKDFKTDSTKDLFAYPKVRGHGLCIDGISTGSSGFLGMEKYYTNELTQMGVINFTGELRPQLSVDRTTIVNYPQECEKGAEKITKLLLEEILLVTQKHIEKYGFIIESKEFNLIWEYIFKLIGFADNLFINELAATKYGEIYWKGLKNVTDKDISIRDFLLVKDINIKNWHLENLDSLTKNLILTKLMSADEISVNENELTVKSTEVLKTNIIRRRRSYADHDILIRANHWNVHDNELDIVSNLYPLIPLKLFDKIITVGGQNILNKIKILHAYSNGLSAFFNQNPLLINEKLGIYMNERGFGNREISQVYNFSSKRSPITLLDINDRVSRKQKDSWHYFLYVFISPKSLTTEDKKKLSEYKERDSSYFKGVTEGWSLLITAKDINNVVIIPGKCTRDDLIKKLSPEFWEKYKDCTFKFTDETTIKRIL